MAQCRSEEKRSFWRMVFGSDGGGRTGAILYTLVASCKANRVHPYQYLQDIYTRLPYIRQHESLLPVLRAACEQVVLEDGTRPNIHSFRQPLDFLRLLKDYPRPLIELMRDDACLNAEIRDELNSLLPDRWLMDNPAARLEINRSLRLVGEHIA